MRVLITGVSGLLGLNLTLMMRGRVHITGCYWRHPIALDGVGAVRVDLLEPGTVASVVDRAQPEVVVHTAGLTGVDDCEADPDLARRLNVALAIEVAQAVHSRGIKLVHLSSDHVFSGTAPAPWHPEDEAPSPVNIYARTKAQAEQAVRQACPQALVIRTNFYGWGSPVRTSLSDWILAGMREGRELSMFTDVFFTPILINDLGEAMFDLLAAGATGVYHIAGAERLSKFDFAHRLAEVFGIPKPRIRPASVESAGLRAPRPKDMSLSTEKVARLLGCRMPTVVEGLRRLRALEEGGWPHELAAALKAAKV